MWRSAFEMLWFTLAYPVSLVVAVAVGYWFGEVFYRRRQLLWKPSGIESALITIFGLLLSFTLLSSNNALRERTALIHETAGALGEVYQESQLLPAPEQAAIRAVLLRFLALELAQHGAGQSPPAGHARQLTQLYWQAWHQFGLGPAGQLSGPALRQLLPAFNRLSAASSRLHYANQDRTPHAIIVLLVLSSWAIGALVGFTNNSQGERHYFVPLLFVIISVLTVQAIRDLDNPEMGLIRPNYSNLEDLQRFIARDSAAAQ